MNADAYLFDELLSVKDTYDFMPIHLAVKNGNFILTEYLIKKSKTQLNYTGGIFGNSLIHFAAYNGSTKILGLLIEHKVELKANNSRYL
jgi:ankyrin repeat protein